MSSIVVFVLLLTICGCYGMTFEVAAGETRCLTFTTATSGHFRGEDETNVQCKKIIYTFQLAQLSVSLLTTPHSQSLFSFVPVFIMSYFIFHIYVYI